MSRLLDADEYDPDGEANPFAASWALHDAWVSEDWEGMRRLLSEDVVFESPGSGRIQGASAVVEHFREQRRFPQMTGLEHRRTVADDDVAMRTYTVYLGHTRQAVALDQLTLVGGRIGHWFSFDQTLDADDTSA